MKISWNKKKKQKLFWTRNVLYISSQAFQFVNIHIACLHIEMLWLNVVIVVLFLFLNDDDDVAAFFFFFLSVWDESLSNVLHYFNFFNVVLQHFVFHCFFIIMRQGSKGVVKRKRKKKKTEEENIRKRLRMMNKRMMNKRMRRGGEEEEEE